MNTVPVKHIRLELEDGQILEFNLPSSSQGFYRQRITATSELDKDGRFVRWVNSIYYHELVWTLSEEENNSNQYQSTLSSSTGSNSKTPSDSTEDEVA